MCVAVFFGRKTLPHTTERQGNRDHCSTRRTTPCSATARTEGTTRLFVLRNPSCGPPTRPDPSECIQPTTTTALVCHHGPRPPRRQIGEAHSTPHHPSYGGSNAHVEQTCSTLSRRKRRHDDTPTRR